MRKVLYLTIISLMICAWETITDLQKLEMNAKKAACKAYAAKISAALEKYYLWHFLNHNLGPPFPISLQDKTFINKFLGGGLPPHPLGKDWNSFYDHVNGKIAMNKACAIPNSGEKISIEEQIKKNIERQPELQKREKILSVTGILRKVSTEELTIESINHKTGRTKEVKLKRDPSFNEMIDELRQGDRIEVEYKVTKDSIKYLNMQLLYRIIENKDKMRSNKPIQKKN